MTRTDGTRSILLSSLVVMSVVAGSVALSGTVNASASNLSIVSEQPVAGTGPLTVRTTVSTAGAKASFKVQDAEGLISATTTVTDGGSADESSRSGVVQTTLDLDALFESKPASGTGVVYAAQDDSFSISQQTFDTKRQVSIDADAPSVEVTGSSTGDREPVSAYGGDSVTIYYTVTDVPEKVESATMRIVGPDGNVRETFTGLQAGTDRSVQFTLPTDWEAGEYDVSVTAVDEVGHRTTDAFVDGLRVKSGNPSVEAKNLEIVSTQPLKGTGTATVRATVSTPGTKASFKVEDAEGLISATTTVTDGGSADESSRSGVVETTLDLDALFASKPASGTGIVYAAGGVDSFSIAQQTYDTKVQTTVDADAPVVEITGGSSNQPAPVYGQTGKEVQIRYTITDEPQKIRSSTMQIIGPNGDVLKTITGLQPGTNQNAQFVVPLDWEEAHYTITLAATDEVGHRTSDTYVDGLVIDNTQPTVESVTTGDVAGGPSTVTNKMVVEIREMDALDPETISKEDFEVPDYQEEDVEVHDGNVVITLEPPNNVDKSDDAPLLERGERPALYLEKGEFIADMAGNRLEGKQQITDAATDGLVPRNPDSISITPDPVSDPSSVTIGVHFTKRVETSSGHKLVEQPPEGGTVYVRLTGPDGTTVVRSMPADIDAEVTSDTFDLTGTGLSAGEVKVEAKIVDDSADTWSNPHGYDANAYFTLETST